MTDLRKAAQQALEAWFRPHGINYVDFKPYMEALKQALAEPEQEPVAWIDPKHLEWLSKSPDNMTGAGLAARKPTNADMMPLYTAPPQRKPLTDEELRECWDQVGNNETVWAMRVQFARAIERAHGIGEQHE